MSRCQYVGAVVVACLLTTVGGAFAETYYVPDDFETIQGAIVAVNDGDEIGVRPDTYNEAIDFLGKAIRLFSPDGPETTILDGTGLDTSVVKCVNGETNATILEGFTITGGAVGTYVEHWNVYSGGGMYIYASGPTIRNCIFRDNDLAPHIDQNAGGGISCEESSQTTVIASCTFMRNTALWGGGLCVFDAAAIVIDCTFEDNRAETESSDIPLGGGLYNDASDTTVTSCTFTRNQAVVGAGMSNFGSFGPTRATVTNCTFDGNVASNSAGGLDSINDADLILHDCVFTGNSARFGGALRTNWLDTVTPMVSACAFSDNEAQYGGGMMVWSADAMVSNCVFMDNEAAYGGAISLRDSGSVVTNSTLLHNNATVLGGGTHSDTGSLPSLRNSIIWANTNGQIVDADTSSTTVSYSDIEGGHDGTGNIDVDPMCERERGRPLAGSPCIDAGDNTALPEDATTDVDGYPRFINDPCTPDTGNPDGLNHPVDMGAYEFQPPCPADLDCSTEIDFGDVLSILSSWDCTGPCLADLDESGVVDFGDVLVVLREWGQPCLCEVCSPVDDCDQAPMGGDGFYAFSNRHATTDGPALPPGCDEGNGLLFRKDVWMKYMALCDGTVMASVCDSDFDTRMAVYEYSEDECPGVFLACSDDACGENGTRSEVSFPVESGGIYLIRIGARFAVGDGTLMIECVE